MARCRNHTRSRHSKVCVPSTSIGYSLIRRRNHHDRTHHPSYDRRQSRIAAVGAIAVAGALMLTALR